MKQFYKVVFLLFMTFSLHAQDDPVDISCEGSLTVDVGGSSSGDSLTISGVTTDNMCDPSSGDVTGSIDITVLGGTPFVDVDGNESYVYYWEQDGTMYSTEEDLDDLVAGTYCVTVTTALTPSQAAAGLTASDCIVEACYVITQPPPVTLSLDTDPLTCNEFNGAPDGIVTATPGGGVPFDPAPAYLYEWEYEGSYTDALVNTSGSPNTNPLDEQVNLPAGWYFVTVYDSQGCLANDSIEITQPDSLLLTAVVEQPDCNEASTPQVNGSIDITLTNGQAPFTYLWTGDASTTTEDLDQLGTGTYTVVVTDANGCSVTGTYDLVEPTPVEIAGTPDEPDCNAGSGALDGGITIEPSGGTGTDNNPADSPDDYTYAWAGTGVDATAQNQTGLGTGTYNVTVTDALGCTATAEYTLTEPEAIAVNGTPDEPDCNAGSGALDGAIDIEPTGGTGVYTYAWTGTGVDATAQDQTGLGTGTYTVVVTDANGCSATEEYTLTEPEAVAVNGTPDEPGCNSGSGALDGGITIAPTGGTGTYTYAWTGPGVDATAQNQTGLGTGTYNVTVTDSNNCTDSAEFTLTEPEAIAINGTPDLPDCNAASGALDGAIDIEPTGGTGVYTYAWTSTGTAVDATAQDQTGLGAGTYTVVVTDANGCSATEEWIVTEPDAVEVSIEMTPLTCNAALALPDGTVTITVAGGTDSNGDPADDISDYTVVWGDDGFGESGDELSNLSAGTYSVTVTDANGCSDETTIDVPQPPTIQAIASGIDPLCHDDSGAPTGEIIISSVVGGTGTDGQPGDEFSDYTYTWAADAGNIYGSNLDLSASNITTQTGLSAGTYTITITDNNGCELVNSITLEEPTPITVTGDITQPACNDVSGDLSGGIDITPGGGIDGSGSTPNYTYQWEDADGNDLGTDQDLASLGEGWYYVTVYDGNCTANDSFNLTEPEPVVCVLSNDPEGGCNDILCAGGVDTIFVTPSGGTAPYTYSLDGATAIGDSFFIVGAGTYTVTTIDANNCTSECEITLTEPNPLAGGTCTLDDDCQIGEGQIEVAATGGCAPYTVTWTSPTGGTLVPDPADVDIDGNVIITNEGGSTIFTGAEGGETYNFTIIDANGCQIP